MPLLPDGLRREGRREVGGPSRELSRMHPRYDDDGGRSTFPDLRDWMENFRQELEHS